MKKTLVLGLGNDLYGDDGVGIHVIHGLRKECESQKIHPSWFENVVLEECSLSGLSILDVIVGYDRLIIIDTIKKQNPETGKIHILEEKDVRHIPGPSPHYVSIPQAMEIGRKFGLKVPSQMRIIAGEAKNLYNLGEGLTKRMKEVLPEIVRQVKKELES